MPTIFTVKVIEKHTNTYKHISSQHLWFTAYQSISMSQLPDGNGKLIGLLFFVIFRRTLVCVVIRRYFKNDILYYIQQLATDICFFLSSFCYLFDVTFKKRIQYWLPLLQLVVTVKGSSSFILLPQCLDTF